MPPFNIPTIPAVLGSSVAALLGFGANRLYQSVHNYLHQDEIRAREKVDTEKVESEAGLVREKERETEINSLRESIRGLRDIIAELRTSRDEALEARRLMTVVVDTLNGKLSILELEVRRRDEKCEERIALFEQNYEKRIEMLKRQHTEEIAELARQLATTLRGPKGDKGEQGEQGEPGPAKPARKRGTEPNIPDAVESIVAKITS